MSAWRAARDSSRAGARAKPTRAKPKRAGARRPAPRPAPVEYRVLVVATLCLIAFGAVMVYSASSARNLLSGHGNGTQYFVRTVIFALIGLVAMQAAARVPLDAVRRATPLLLAGSMFLVLCVLVPGVGIEVNGARRWIGPGSLSFQPSELLKIALVLYAAGYCATARPARLRTIGGIMPVLLALGGGCLLIAVEPDLGTSMVVAGSVAAVLIAAGVPIRNLLMVAGAAALVLLLVALAEPYQRARLTSFLNPWADSGGAGFQAVQGQIALGSGGIFGVGLGESVQKVFYLPEAHTDFILAVIGEELGLAGILGVIGLYSMVLYGGLRTARNARGRYAKLLAAGLTSIILCQATLNIFVVLGLAPLTGVPLPLISYGPTNLCVLLVAMGLLLNVSRGGTVSLRAVPDGRGGRERDADRDRGGRDGGPRRAGPDRRRRAAG